MNLRLLRLRCHVVLSRTHLEAMAAAGWSSAVMSDKLTVRVYFFCVFLRLWVHAISILVLLCNENTHLVASLSNVEAQSTIFVR